MQMTWLKKRVRGKEIPQDDLPNLWFKRKEISLIEGYYKLAQARFLLHRDMHRNLDYRRERENVTKHELELSV